MWNQFSEAVQHDLIICAVCAVVAAVIAVKMLVGYIRDIRTKCREMPVITSTGEYTLTAEKDGTASFVIIVDGKPHKITLRGGETE